MKPTILHRQPRVRDGVDDLVQRAAGSEDAERVHERDVPAAGEGRGHADHVRLRHAGVNEAVREGAGEQVDLALPGQVAAQAQHVVAPPRELDQRLAVGLEHGLVRRLTHGRAPAAPSARPPRRRPVRAAA